MTREEEIEAMTLKRRLRVLYRNRAVTIQYELGFDREDYQDVSSAAALVDTLATQLRARQTTPEIKQEEEAHQ